MVIVSIGLASVHKPIAAWKWRRLQQRVPAEIRSGELMDQCVSAVPLWASKCRALSLGTRMSAALVAAIGILPGTWKRTIKLVLECRLDRLERRVCATAEFRLVERMHSQS